MITQHHHNIVALFKSFGWSVVDLAIEVIDSPSATKIPDLIVGWNGVNYLIDTSDSLEAPPVDSKECMGRQPLRLTDEQYKFNSEWRGDYVILKTEMEVFAWLTATIAMKYPELITIAKQNPQRSILDIYKSITMKPGTQVRVGQVPNSPCVANPSGIIGHVISHDDCPDDKIAVQIDATLVGYEVTDDDDELTVTYFLNKNDLQPVSQS